MVEGIEHVTVERSRGGERSAAVDAIAVEEPLEIRVQWMRDGEPRVDTVAITMRTPGHDAELAVGFLFTEGLIRDRAEISDVWSCRPGTMRVLLRPEVQCDLTRLERRSVTSSACGACGKLSVGALAATPPWLLSPNEPRIPLDAIQTLP